MTKLRRGIRILLVAALCSPPGLRAATLEEALQELTRRIRSRVGRSAVVAVEVRPEGDEAERERAANHLARAFGRTPGPGGTIVTVQLSSNRTSKLVVAEVRSSERVVMIEPYEPESGVKAGVLEVSARLLAEGEGRVLAAAESGAGLVLLFADRIELQGVSIPLAMAGPAERDPRGLLEVDGNEVRAWLNGRRCSGTLAPLEMKCAAGDAAWPLGGGETGTLLAGRNFFRHAAGDVYWAAWTPDGVVAAHIDGVLRLHSGNEAAVLDRKGGSEFSVQRGSCAGEGGAVVIASADGGASIQAFRLRGRKWEPGAAAPTKGTVTAIQGALAVTRTEGDGYGVYQVAVRCDP
jgi:hypothetical protein